MKQRVFKPINFCQNFSPDKKAELYLHFVDEQSKLDHFIGGKWLKNILFKIGSNFIIRRYDKKIENIIGEIKTRYNEISPHSVRKFLEEEFSDDHLRKFEYAFLAKCLSRKEIRKDIIVDLGGGFSYSTIVPSLLQIPSMKIISIDVGYQSCQSKFGIEYVLGDCMHTNLPSGSADVVSIISTLEHVGLGRYRDPLAVDGDIRTMQEAWRILKSGGYVVLTIPYGYPTVVFNLHRVYDRGRFGLLIKNFKPIIVEYSFRGNKATRSIVEGKKVRKNIPGFYSDVSYNLRHLDPQGGLMALLKKV